MESVYVITGNDIGCNLTDVVAVFLERGVKQGQVTVLYYSLRVEFHLVSGGKLRGGGSLGAERVDPCMQFHTACMTLVNHELKGIPVLIGSLSLKSGQKRAPRFQIRLVKGIGLNAYLKEYGVDAA